MADKHASVEDGFRDSLKDVVSIANRLSNYCDGEIENLVSVINLAMENDAQLRLLMKLVVDQKR